MEREANRLVAQFRHVLVRAVYDNYVRIRFRADAMRDPRLFFNKVPSQHKRWLERGGALITWRNTNKEGPHDAIILVECPRSVEALFKACAATRTVGVIYEPPSWRHHEATIMKRHGKRPAKLRRHLRRLEVMRSFVSQLPVFTPGRLQTLLRARAAASRSSSSPESLGASAPTSDTRH